MTVNLQFPKPVVAGSTPVARSQRKDFRLCHTPAHVYHGWGEVSCSQLKQLCKSPLTYWHRFVQRDAPNKFAGSLQYGTLLHARFELGREEFYRQVVRPDAAHLTKSGALSTKGMAWLAGLPPDTLVLTPDDERRLEQQTARLLELEPVRRILDRRVDAEFNIRWNWDGHACRCRVDGATPDFFFDWKTTRDEHPLETFWQSVKKYGYHLQSAMYQSAGETAGLLPSGSRMVFIVTSTVWPYEAACVRLPYEWVEQGRRECLRLLNELEARKEWNFWHRHEALEITDLRVPRSVMKGV